MKKIVTAITLASLLGCEQTPKQKSVDNVVEDEPVVKEIRRLTPESGYCASGPQYNLAPSKKHEHVFFHDMLQGPKSFSGVIESWIANTGKPCLGDDGLSMDVYTFRIKTSEGVKELSVFGFSDEEKKYLKGIAVRGVQITCSNVYYASLRDFRSGAELYQASVVLDVKKTEDLKK